MVKILQVLTYYFVVVSINCYNLKSFSNENHNHSLRPPMRLGAPSHVFAGEHISLTFYRAAENAESMKNKLQEKLNNFLDNLQKNLTTSSVLNTVVNTIDLEKTQHQLRKLNDLSAFFQSASEVSEKFANVAEYFFEVSKNESNQLLLKLRNVPSAQRNLSARSKIYLTDYFAEMEYFHLMFSEIVDEALEFIIDTLRTTQQTFIIYADLQRDVLRNWNFKPDEWCCNRYMDFLQEWSASIFKCAAGSELDAAYDIFAMTEVMIRFVMQHLEFRIQRLYNCFLFGNYQLRCRFLRHAEQDFEKLFTKLEELQIYYDLRIQGGRILANRKLLSKQKRSTIINTQDSTREITEMKNNCIPRGFPQIQMISSLKSCFYFPELH